MLGPGAARCGPRPGIRALFRHKTRKQPFSRNLHAIAVLQLLGLGAALGWLLGG